MWMDPMSTSVLGQLGVNVSSQLCYDATGHWGRGRRNVWLSDHVIGMKLQQTFEISNATKGAFRYEGVTNAGPAQSVWEFCSSWWASWFAGRDTRLSEQHQNRTIFILFTLFMFVYIVFSVTAISRRDWICIVIFVFKLPSLQMDFHNIVGWY